MEISGEFTFDAKGETVWEVLQDPNALATIIPMAMNIKRIADNRYSGDLFFKVGNFAGTFHGTIQLSNLQPPDSYDIEVQGSSAIGRVDIKGGMYLKTNNEQTVMFYSGNIAFGGRIASVGSRLLELSVRSMLQQSFKTLNNYLSIKRSKL
jgi:uncharacterized protein